jgi:hypothetical protein
MSEMCRWIHHKLEVLPIIKFPFDLKELPENGIYFFYEKGEDTDHGDGFQSRIVRIGTHKEGNFRTRIAEHFLLNVSKMNFSSLDPKPADRSIFRKNIGRALLSKNKDEYLKIWNIDFTSRDARMDKGYQRDMVKERKIESQITEILREIFCFRFIVLDREMKRIGSKGLESKLIGTVANCSVCKHSDNWLGTYSPIPKVHDGKLWLSQYLDTPKISSEDQQNLSEVISNTEKWIQEKRQNR